MLRWEKNRLRTIQTEKDRLEILPRVKQELLRKDLDYASDDDDAWE